MRRIVSLVFKRGVAVSMLLAIVALVLGPVSTWGSLAPTPAVAAGSDLRVKQVKVSLWPEYDDPRLLVIYEGEFADGGTFPRDVSFRTPKDAFIGMACALTPKGEHLCQPYDTTVEGDYKVISFKLPIPTFFFEYYAGGIEGASEKSIKYQFVNPPYAIDSLELEIQQPLKATNFVISPAATAQSSDAQGFKYHNYRLGTVAADKVLNFAVSYTKSDPNPSVQKKSDATTTPESNNSLIIVGSVGGMGAILLVSYWLATKRNQRNLAVRTSSAVRARKAERNLVTSRSGSTGSRTAGPSAPGALHCSNCGVRLGPDDKFCYNCGEPPRRGRNTPRGGKR